MSTSFFEDNIIQGIIIGSDLNRSPSCPLCNTKNESHSDDNMITCTGCKTTILTSMLKMKLVCKIAVQVDDNITMYSAFNDALESCITLKHLNAKLTDLKDDEITEFINSRGTKDWLIKQRK